jgi:hypothetical protein
MQYHDRDDRVFAKGFKEANTCQRLKLNLRKSPSESTVYCLECRRPGCHGNTAVFKYSVPDYTRIRNLHILTFLERNMFD